MIKIKTLLFFSFVVVVLFGVDLSAISKPVFDARFHSLAGNEQTEDSANAFKGSYINSSYHYKRGSISNINFEGLCDYPYFDTSDSGVIFNINKPIINKQVSALLWFTMSPNMVNTGTLIQVVNRENRNIFTIRTTPTQGSFSDFRIYIDNKLNNTVNGFGENKSIIKKGKWTHFAFTYDAEKGELILYVNGSLYKKIIFPKSGLRNNVKQIYIGNDRSRSHGLIGGEDEVKIFNTILLKEDIQSIFNNESKYYNYDATKRQCSQKICSLEYVSNSDPIADIFGKSVFTKKQFTYRCRYITEERGTCKTEDVTSKYTVPTFDQNASYLNTFAGGDLKEIAKIASAQSYSNKIMTGWHGYCVKGLEEDFSWASDPYFWGGLALSTAAGYIGGSGATDVATKSGTDAAVKTGTDTAVKTGTGAVTNATTQTATEGGKKALEEAAKKKLFQKLSNYAICAAQSGLDLAQLAQTSTDKIPCDPVDEICGEKSNSYDDQVYTLDEQSYNDMLATNPSFADNLDIVSQEDGVVKFYIRYNLDEDMSDDELKKAMAEQAKKVKEIQQVAIAATAAVCLGSAALGDGANTASATAGQSKDDPGFSAADGATMIGSTVANVVCGPLCGAAVQVVGKFAQSFQFVDSCKSEDDASTKGSRHISTYNARKMDLCRYTYSTCLKKDITGTGCQLRAKHFCCYDTVLTKILAEQIKAQLAISWTHCTGISLNEFMHISFKTCSQTNGGTDGTQLPYDSTIQQRKSAFQYTDRCIDYTDYIDYIKRFTNGRLNTGDIQDMLDSGTTVEQCSF